jgi:hypothetical protein
MRGPKLSIASGGKELDVWKVTPREVAAPLQSLRLDCLTKFLPERVLWTWPEIRSWQHVSGEP